TEDFKILLAEFYAVPEKRKRMTDEEIKDLAHRLNEKINIPLVKETGEEKILIKIILKIDTFLYDHLPNEFYDLIRTTDNGITKAEAKSLVRRLTKMANKKIDIPYLPEAAEHFVFKFIIGIIVRAARNKLNFEAAKNELNSAKINATDDDIVNMVVK
ncbi:MAG TPA: hypothetical protein VKA38_02320, partial [Draconibacterium sp.]|nr:hypothetical protein [Draconibacterium sp.]